MGKIFQQNIIRFSGGIGDDIRMPISDSAANVKHFNIFDNPYKLTPYRSTEADTNDGSTATGTYKANQWYTTNGSSWSNNATDYDFKLIGPKNNELFMWHL